MQLPIECSRKGRQCYATFAAGFNAAVKLTIVDARASNLKDL